MSFDNDYPRRKDRRRPYRGPKAVDPHCRNHGACDYCRLGRAHKNERRAPADDPDETINPGGRIMGDDSDPGGHGVAYVDVADDSILVVRNAGSGMLTFDIDSRIVVVDLGAFLVDLQLTADDCRRALDGFGDQGFDRPDDATEPTP